MGLCVAQFPPTRSLEPRENSKTNLSTSAGFSSHDDGELHLDRPDVKADILPDGMLLRFDNLLAQGRYCVGENNIVTHEFSSLEWCVLDFHSIIKK
jgi:hypothetical protein